MKIIAISGSLRSKSYNSTIVTTLCELNEDVHVSKIIQELPFFNQDLDKHSLTKDDSPAEVIQLREQLNQADAIIFSTPEYAFEISGVLKNALEWLVSSGTLDQKPIAVISSSTSVAGAKEANLVLTKLVGVLTGRKDQVTLCVGKVNNKIDTNGVAQKDLREELSTILDTLITQVKGI